MPKGQYKRNDKWLKTLSEKMKGNSFNLGRKTSEETKKKISLIKKGKVPYKMTEKTKKAMSLARLGNKNPAYKDGRSYDKDYSKKKALDYRHRHLEHSREKTREYQRNNLAKFAEYARKRRLLKLKCGGFHTIEEWEMLKVQYNFTCPCCGLKEPEIKLTVDHIISLSKGGSDNIENIQPLCGPCNAAKGNRHDTKY